VNTAPRDRSSASAAISCGAERSVPESCATDACRNAAIAGTETNLLQLRTAPPYSRVEPVTEMLHGVPITDPYRWLEDQESPRTREWLAAQTEFARAYLDAIPARERIRERIRELLDVETYDSIQRVSNKYVFRKRVCGQEQPCIYLREGRDGRDELLLDPADRGTGKHTALKPLLLSQDGRLLLYEVKEGGERTGTFELFDVEKREKLPDALPQGYLGGFSFAPDTRSFDYVHQALGAKRPYYRAAFHHVLGASFEDDHQIFCAGEDAKLRLHIIPGEKRLGFLVIRCSDKTYVDFYLRSSDNESSPELLVEDADYKFGPLLLKDRILAITDRDSPNSRIVEVRPRAGYPPDFVDVIAESDCPIRDWAVTSKEIYVSYTRGVRTEIHVFGLEGERLGQLPLEESDTVRIVGASAENDELFIEQESFTKPIQIWCHSAQTRKPQLWSQKTIPFNSGVYAHVQVWFSAKDGTRIPMFLVGRQTVFTTGLHPTIMTSYGGYGVPMTPQFSVFVSFLMERGCLFALPNIRGGSEFGVEWHEAAKRRNRQVAIDDFVAAAEWLIETGRTTSEKLAIFGGSNSGLLVGAALTQRPNLFRAVVCMVPLLDMLRYHLFDNAHAWVDEFGTAEDPDDFPALARYSPYHHVRDGVAYPATMIVSGDADRNCNPLHARKMTARLQAASASNNPIVLDYSRFRGHSPVLPLSERIEALTDRMAFLCQQLRLPV
jgi:prolyl oligopeptidase